MSRFSVSYEIVTPESAEQGDAAERGWIAQGLSLREALATVGQSRTAHCDGVTAIEACVSQGRPCSLVVTHGMEYLTGAYESRTLHVPVSVTDSSATRIARLLGAR